jgi:hypothetical protein
MTTKKITTCLLEDCLSTAFLRAPVTSLFIITNYSQQDVMFLDLFIFTEALHVSDGFSANHQEHITVHIASGIVNQYCW